MSKNLARQNKNGTFSEKNLKEGLLSLNIFINRLVNEQDIAQVEEALRKHFNFDVSCKNIRILD